MSLQLTPARQREILGLLLSLAGALTFVALLGYAGILSAVWARLLLMFSGWCAYLIAAALFIGGILLLRRDENVFDEFPVAWGRIVAFEVLFAVIAGLVTMAVAPDDAAAARLAEAGQAGGYLGYAVAALAIRSLGSVLGAVALVLIGLVSVRFAFDLRGIGELVSHGVERLKPAETAYPRSARSRSKAPEPAQAGATRAVPSSDAPAPAIADLTSGPGEVTPAKIKPDNKVGASPRAPIFGLGRKHAPPQPKPTWDPLLQIPQEKSKARTGRLPSLDLLVQSSEAQYAQSRAAERAHKIEETLGHFGIPAKVVDVLAGPTITQFAVEPGFIERRGPDGSVIYQRKVPVNRILALSNDLALALEASPIRIEAPVPGRKYVGIEVPNDQIALVSLREVVESPAYKKLGTKTRLPLALGKDVSGAAAVADLGTMPHMLIAGATGSGKSVCINAVIACMLLAHSPDTLRMIMVDPKRVELVNFNGIPHLLGQVITDVEKVVPALRWAVGLMDARFRQFSKEGARNIEAYNAKMDRTGGPKLPYVLIIIDELADLMLASPEETEKLITRLAQMARATGLHLILATQRPSVDVVTGLIKANFPARISFSVTSSVDSRVVLDTPGAEKLLGRGDMLYMAPDSAKLVRLQGCFVSDEELTRLADHWRKQQEDFEYIESAPWDGQAAGGEENGHDGDELAEKAIDVIRSTNKASISSLQTKLGIGYPRAARLMDQLEQMGVVGPDEGSGKPRAILLADNGKKKK